MSAERSHYFQVGTKFAKLAAQCVSIEEYSALVDAIAKESGRDRDFIFMRGYSTFKDNVHWNQPV